MNPSATPPSNAKTPSARGSPLARARLLACASVLAWLCLLPLSPGALAREAPSRYPAAATRPYLIARPSDFAHPSSPQAGEAARRSRRPKKPPHRKPRVAPLRGNPARALLAFQAMQRTYYVGSGLYIGEPFAYLFPFAEAFAATLSMAEIPHMPVSFAREVNARLVGLAYYHDTEPAGAPEGIYTSTLPAYDATVVPPVGPGSTKYYDDNDWVGLELVRAYRLTRSPAVLAAAEEVMAFEMAGWDGNQEHGCPGGIPFSNSSENTSRNTVSTAPAAEIAVRLYQITGNPQYLQFAEMAYEWVRRCLLGANGLYADSVSPKGVVEPMTWSYNQGNMIGAATLLYQATGNAAFLLQARECAHAALAYFTPERLAAEPSFFPAVYFRDLIYMDSVTHEAHGRPAAQAYADYAWQHLRLVGNLFVYGSPPSAHLLGQASMTQIYAMLSSPPSTYF